METKQSVSLLDLCVDAVLGVTPRKLGRLVWKLGKAIWDKATKQEVKQFRGELQALKAQQA